jgi:hypothetical protein
MHGMLGQGYGVTPFEGHMIHFGGGLDALGIVCLVLGLILWALVATTLVLVIMEFLRRRRRPKTPPEVVGYHPALAQPDVAPEGPEAQTIVDGHKGELTSS